MVYLFREIDHAAPTIVGVDRRLQREYNRSERNGGSGVPLKARERTAAAKDERSNNQSEKGERLQQAGKVLNIAAPNNSAPLQNREDNCHCRGYRGGMFC